MKTQPLVVSGLEARAARPDRPATAVLHDAADLRLVVFRLEPGQEVARHTSSSTVSLVVIEGGGWVTGAEGERAVTTGDLVVYAPNEPHGMRATEARMLLLAAIAPGPGAG